MYLKVFFESLIASSLLTAKCWSSCLLFWSKCFVQSWYCLSVVFRAHICRFEVAQRSHGSARDSWAQVQHVGAEVVSCCSLWLVFCCSLLSSVDSMKRSHCLATNAISKSLRPLAACLVFHSTCVFCAVVVCNWVCL